ncbi:hypothetical protein P168DRAFT_53065 [Aspergillus campestris IBT 28561]|uniref:HNH nuclease domain-containing protein n=1 Tax=Aspergillus campestris (strain IBT 28561) TaxID=1392248 RepID=A0A2I1CVG5_ASPC2|nr:uncharacterized protein P168DRAFT_53065 [Aspergillus campestris IBT 28561]PKY01612.1 hypothetical protein P168DRAFT_53065 [Aspergillus campestris IBT 28561]
MSSQESLSPAVSSNVFATFAEAKQTLDRKLEQHQPLHPEDDTASFLRIFHKYLPLQGQVNLAEDVERCADNEELRQLAESLDTGLLRPMLAHGGTTPAVTLSPRLGVEDSIEALLSDDTQTASRSEQQLLRNHCLDRDGYQCVVTKAWSSGYDERPSDSIHAPLEAAHIIPFALGVFQENSADERYRHAMIWVNINRYFPDLRSRMGFSSEDINQEENVMMLVEGLHGQFGSFHFVLEATQTPHRYRVKTFSKFASLYLRFLPPDGFVTLTSHDGRYPLPSPILLAVHAAIGNILNLSGRGDKIEELKRHLGGMGGGLSRDGSTRVEDLLSVSKLSILSSGANRQPHPYEKQRRMPTMFPGTENQMPSS